MFNLFQAPPNQRPLTIEEVEVRVWAVVVIVVTMILAGIVAFVLYSVTFVTQPIKSMAPIDQAYTKMLNDIVLLIVGGIGGVMSKKGVQSISEKVANHPPPPPPAPQQQDNDTIIVTNSGQNGMPNFNWMGYKNPELDDNWRPPPPPSTPPDHLEPDDVRQETAAIRAAGKHMS